MDPCNENTPLLHCNNHRGNHIVDIPSNGQTMTKSNGSSTSSFESESIGSLSMEELLMYKEDPRWLIFRRFIFYGFWAVWLVILVTACLLAYMQKDTCVPPPQPVELTTTNAETENYSTVTSLIDTATTLLTA